MIDRKHDPEIDRVRNMLCSKGTLAGILILCDLLEPVIVFSDNLQSASIDFSHVNKKAKDLTDTLHTLTERFQDSIQTPDADLCFSKMPALSMEIDERTILMRRLRATDGVYDLEHLVNEVAIPITHHLIKEIEDAFSCSTVLSAFDAFSLESVPDDIQELKDYKKEAIKTLASHYGGPRLDVFMGHRIEVHPVYTEESIFQEFNQFKRQMLMLK